MVNWKTYKINSMVSDHSRVMFNLGPSHEVHVDYRSEVGDIDDVWYTTCIFCANTYPFNTWKEGDYIEIDNDKTCNYKRRHRFDDTSIIRKASSSNEMVSRNNNLPSITRNQTLAIGREIDALIDQSEGKNEYEAKIHVDPDNKVSGYSIIGRRK